MTQTVWPKDPAAVLDYAVDWADWLSTGETITTATVTVPTGITLDSDTIFDGHAVVFWLSGGTAGTEYPVTCRIGTNQARTDERTIGILCQQR